MTQNRRLEKPNTQIRRISPGARAAFFGAVLFGLISQGMGLFNKFSWHDDIFTLFLTGATITSGRWMLHVLAELEILIFGDGHYSLPLMNGLFSLICIGVSAGLIAQLLKIRKSVYCVLLGAVMAAFPVVTALFGFMFTVSYYMLAALMIVTGAYLICTAGRWQFKAAGVVLAGCSVGIYQAFLPMLLSVILLYDLMILAEEEEKVSEFLKRLMGQGVCVLAAMAVYLAGSRLFLWKYDMQLDDYMGISQAASVTLATYLHRAARAYQEFFRPTRNVLWDMYPQHLHYLYLGMLCVDMLLGIRLIVRTWQRDKGKAVLLLFLLALVPLTCNFIFLMSDEVHSLMVFGQTMQIVLFVLLADRLEIHCLGARQIVSLGAAIMLGVMCIMYARYDNQCYLKMIFQQQEAISWYTTLITQIKSTQGYRDELPVAWVGRENLQDQSLYHIHELDFLKLAGYDQGIQEYINSWSWETYLARWCGFRPEKANPEAIKNLREVQTMPHYPDDGSIRIINDIIVVNF